MEFALETQLIYNVLAVVAVVLLITVTGGVIYLTLIDWKDRRNKSREVLDNLPRIRKYDPNAKRKAAEKAKSDKKAAKKAEKQKRKRK